MYGLIIRGPITWLRFRRIESYRNFRVIIKLEKTEKSNFNDHSESMKIKDDVRLATELNFFITFERKVLQPPWKMTSFTCFELFILQINIWNLPLYLVMPVEWI